MPHPAPEITDRQRLLGRCAVFIAVLMQSIGQVAYGTWLAPIPSPLFVFGSFLLAAMFFLLVSGRGARNAAWGPLLLLNVATAIAFLSFFYALRLVEPAIASALNAGVGPLFAVLVALFIAGITPSRLRIAVCLGVLAGCGVLALAAASETSGTAQGHMAGLGIAAGIATGCGGALITLASKALLNRGWSSGAVLAHRFYLILPISLLLTLTTSDITQIEWSGALVMIAGAVAILGVIAPLYLLQVGIRLSEPYTVLVTMAAQPLITFALQGLSPAYAWTPLTALGLLIITAAIGLDIMARTKPAQ